MDNFSQMNIKVAKIKLGIKTLSLKNYLKLLSMSLTKIRIDIMKLKRSISRPQVILPNKMIK